jgi:hypothetical protein
VTLLEGSRARHPDGGGGSGKAALYSVMSPDVFDARLDDEVESAADALRTHQREDGHWLYDLEADATISSANPNRSLKPRWRNTCAAFSPTAIMAGRCFTTAI